MTDTLAKSLIAFLSTGMVFWGAVVVFRRGKNLPSFLQLVGAGCLAVVALTHIFEALRLFPSLGWGEQHSIGHHVDLARFWWLIAGLILGSVIPFTLVVIMPTNGWSRLHAVRSVLSGFALLIFLYLLVFEKPR